MRIIRLLAFILFALPLFAQVPPPPHATSNEVRNAANVQKYVNPADVSNYLASAGYTPGGGGSTNSIPPVREAYVLNTPVTNTGTGSRLYFMAYTAIGTGVAGNSQLSIYGNDTGAAAVTNFFPLKQSSVATSLATTNTYYLSFIIGSGGRWYPTNESAGTGDSVSLVAGSMGYQQITSGTNGATGATGATGPQGPALGSTNGTVDGFNVPAFTNWGVGLTVGRETNASSADILGAWTNYSGIVFSRGIAPAYSLYTTGSGADAKWWVWGSFGNSNIFSLYSDAGGLNTSNGLAMFRNGNDPLEFQSNFRTNRLKGDLILMILTNNAAGLTNLAFDPVSGKVVGVAAPAASGATGGNLTNGFAAGVNGLLGDFTNMVRQIAGNVIYSTNKEQFQLITVDTNFTYSGVDGSETFLNVSNSGSFKYNISTVTQWPNGTNLPPNQLTRIKIAKYGPDVIAYVGSATNRFPDQFTVIGTNGLSSFSLIANAQGGWTLQFNQQTNNNNFGNLNAALTLGASTTITTNAPQYPIINASLSDNQAATNTFTWRVSDAESFIRMTNATRIVISGVIGAGLTQNPGLTVSNASGSAFTIYFTNTFRPLNTFTNLIGAGKVAVFGAKDFASTVYLTGVVEP